MQRPARSPSRHQLDRQRLDLIHPATRPPTRIRRPRAATHAHMCAHPSRPKRDRRQPPRPIRSAKLRKPAGIIPHTRGRPRAGTVAEHHSAHTETHEDAGTVAESSPQCGRTLPCRPPNRGRVVSVRRNRNPGTSTTHERKRVCRWEAHQSLAPAGQRDAPRRIKRARPGGEAAATSSPKAVLAGELGLPS